MNRFYFLIPTFFDLLTSTMQFIAFNFISASAYQMMKGGSIITTFIFSVTFLKMPILRRQLVGSILAFIGIFIVGLANTIFTS
jgi:drug/metabolite transporter (DMT)-like permease